MNGFVVVVEIGSSWLTRSYHLVHVVHALDAEGAIREVADDLAENQLDEITGARAWAFALGEPTSLVTIERVYTTTLTEPE